MPDEKPDAGHADPAAEAMLDLAFDLLLSTDGRTTDLLEMLLGEKLAVSVLRQERTDAENGGFPAYVRESLLIGERSGAVASHNIALVDARHVPEALFRSIAVRQEGIGKAMAALGIRSFRKVLDAGSVAASDAADLAGRPVALRFPASRTRVPYKKYAMYFGAEPGIMMLEYFDPILVLRRLSLPGRRRWR